MKIYFCDGCNESIPLSDLEKGPAFAHDGKIFCGRPGCAQGDLHRREVTQSRGGSALTWVAVGIGGLALVAAGAAIAHSFGVSGDVDAVPRYEGELGKIDERLGGLLAGLDRVEVQQGALKDDLVAARRDFTRLDERLAASGDRLDEVERGLRDQRTVLELLDGDREELQKLELSREQVEQSIVQLRESIANVEGRVAELGSSGGAGDRGRDLSLVIGAGGGSGSGAPVPAFDEETRLLIEDLDSPDASVRWSAVDRLAGLREPALVPFLVPLLEDRDAFVQFRVISTLRELNARSAVSKLISLLRDGDAIVREEALEALVTLTGRAERFDVTNGSAADREEGVRIWEDWYRENRDRFE